MAPKRKWGSLDQTAEKGMAEISVDFPKSVDVDIMVVQPDHLLNRLMTMCSHRQKRALIDVRQLVVHRLNAT